MKRLIFMVVLLVLCAIGHALADEQPKDAADVVTVNASEKTPAQLAYENKVLQEQKEDQQPKGPPSIEELEQLESILRGEKLIDELEILRKSMKDMWAERRYDCLKAFGHREFCSCLNDNLSAFLTFDDYIISVTESKEELNYQSRAEDERNLIDNAIRVRDECVAKCFQ